MLHCGFAFASCTVMFLLQASASESKPTGLIAHVYYDDEPLRPATGYGVAKPMDQTPEARPMNESIKNGVLTIGELGEGLYILAVFPKEKQGYDARLFVGIRIVSGDNDLGRIVLPKKRNLPRITLYGRISDSRSRQIGLRQARITFPACPNTTNVPVGENGSFQIQVRRCSDYTFTIKADGYREIDANIPESGADVFSMDAQMESNLSASVEGPNELPNLNRNFTSLELLAPGVSNGAYGGNNSFVLQTSSNSFILQTPSNGMRPTVNTTILDGADVSYPNHAPPKGGAFGEVLGGDSIQEVKVETDWPSAEFGRPSSAVLQVVTKSGTNAFHGSVYEFLRNDAVDAKNFFDRADVAIPPLRHNRFGSAVGGPIVKNNSFFFVNYEGFRERKSETQTLVTPTQGVRASAAPEIVPYLAFYPLPNVLAHLDLGGGVGLFATSSVER